jgi:hypothetical protein
VEFGREVSHLVPGGLVRHLQTGLLEQVLAEHQRRAFTVKWRGVELPIVLQALQNAREQVVVIVTRVLLESRTDFIDPVVLGPQRDLVHADGDQVELSGTGRNVGGHLVADLVLGQHQQIQRDAGMRGLEVALELRERLHLRIADHGHTDRSAGCWLGAGLSGRRSGWRAARRIERAGCAEKTHHGRE